MKQIAGAGSVAVAEMPFAVESFITKIFDCQGLWRDGQKVINGQPVDEPENAATEMVQAAIRQAIESGKPDDLRVMVNAETAVKLHLERRLGWNHQNSARWNGLCITIPEVRFEPEKGSWVSATVMVVGKLEPSIVVI